MTTTGLLPRLTTFDANGFLSAFRQGEADGLARQERENRRRIGDIANSHGFLAGSREALSVGDMDWATRLSQMDTQRQAQINNTLGRLASAADTPDRWNTLIAQMRMRFGPESVQGFEDFSSRQQAIRISMTAAENLAEQHRQAQLAETRRLHNAQIRHMTTQDAAIGENLELRRRQMDAQNLSRDRGFTLRSLTALSRARTPEEFHLVAQTLRPMLGRMPRFEERDRIIQSAMDSLEEFDMGTDEQGRPQRISRGWSPMVLAAIGPQGVGQGQGPPPPQVAPQDAGTAAAGATLGGVSGLRAMIPQNPNGIAPNPAAANLDNNALSRILPGAPQPSRPLPGPDTFMPSVGAPAPAAPAAPAAPQPIGGVAQPVAAPGGIPPPVVGGPGAAMPVQDAPGARPQPAMRGAMAQQQMLINEIEQQYGQPSTWGQNGAQPPPHSVIQRYWRAVRGGRAINGYDYAADGSFVPIAGAPQRGGGGRGGGSTASANAARALESAAGQVADAAEALLHPGTNMVGNMIQSIPGVATLGYDSFQNAQRTISFATREVMHALSGATVTAREFEHYVNTFVPVATDTERQRRFKINSLRQIILSIAQAQASTSGQLSDSDLSALRAEMRNENRRLMGLSNLPAGRGSAPQTGSAPPQATGGGWGGAGNLSTQDILNGLRR